MAETTTLEKWAQQGFKREDEGVFVRDGKYYEQRGDRMVPTGAFIKPASEEGRALEAPLKLEKTDVEDVSLVEADLLMPLAEKETLVDTWNQFKALKQAIIEQGDYDEIGNKKDLNRTGWMKLGVAFGISTEILEERVERDEGRPTIHIRVRAWRGGRSAEGLGSCEPEDIRGFEKNPNVATYHMIRTKAHTRANKRALADLLGGADVAG